MEQLRDDLQRFTEPHLVREDAAELERSQVIEKIEAEQLIVAQHVREHGRRFDVRNSAERAQALAQRVHLGGQRDGAERVLDLIVQRDQRRHPGAAAVDQLREQLALRAQRADVEQLPADLGEPAVGLQERGQLARRERAAFADENADVELEPIAILAAERARRDVHVDRRRVAAERRQRIVDDRFEVVPARDDVAHEGRRALDVVQREHIAAAWDEADLDDAVRELARGARREADEAPVERGDRTVRRERDRRAGLAVDEGDARDQGAVAPGQACPRRRPFGVDHPELAAVVSREERRDPGDRPGRRASAIGRSRARRGDGRRDDLAGIERAVEQIRRPVVDEPRRRAVDDGRRCRREARTVGALEDRDEPVAGAHRPQPDAANVDLEGRQLQRVSIRARRVIEARPRVASQPEERPGEGAPRNAGPKRFLDRLVADQLPIGVVPVIVRGRLHHREHGLGVADHPAQPRRVEIERSGKPLAVSDRHDRPDAAGAGSLDVEIDGGEPGEVGGLRPGVGRGGLVGPADRLEGRHEVLADAGRSARANGPQRLGPGPGGPLDRAGNPAAVADRRFDLGVLNGAQRNAVRVGERERSAGEIPGEPVPDRRR